MTSYRRKSFDLFFYTFVKFLFENIFCIEIFVHQEVIQVTFTENFLKLLINYVHINTGCFILECIFKIAPVTKLQGLFVKTLYFSRKLY